MAEVLGARASSNPPSSLSSPSPLHLRSLAANTEEPWRCFFQQYAAAYITVPVFVFNAAYDAWQVGMISAYHANLVQAAGTVAGIRTAAPRRWPSFRGTATASSEPWAQLWLSLEMVLGSLHVTFTN